MSYEPSSSSFRSSVRTLVGSATDVEEGQASERSSLCEVLYSGNVSDAPRHRRRGRFRDESDEESSPISDSNVPLREDAIITEERFNVEQEYQIDLCSEVSSNPSLLTSTTLGTRVLLVAG